MSGVVHVRERGEGKIAVPCAPHVNLRAIDSRAKQKFWRAIPQSNYSVRVIALSPFLIEPRQAKVGEFQFPATVDQDIGPLDVTMDDSGGTANPPTFAGIGTSAERR